MNPPGVCCFAIHPSYLVSDRTPTNKTCHPFAFAFSDEWCPGSLLFNQYGSWVVFSSLTPDGFYEVWEFYPLSPEVQEVILVVIAYKERQANGIAADSGDFYGGVPGLDNLIAGLASRSRIIPLQPLDLEHVPALRRRVLQVLRAPIWPAHLPFLVFENTNRLTLLQGLPRLPVVSPD